MEDKNTLSIESATDLIKKSHEYAYNIIYDDDYTEEKYNEKTKEIQSRDVKPYSDFSDEEFNINLSHLIEGYAAFGRDFLVATMAKDTESGVNMFETAIQQVLDLTNSIDSFTNMLQNKLNSSNEIHNDNEKGE